MTFKEKLEELVDLFPTYTSYNMWTFDEYKERKILAEKALNFWLFEQHKLKYQVKFGLKELRFKDKVRIGSTSKKTLDFLLKLTVKNNLKIHQYGPSSIIIELSDFDYTLN